MRLEDSTARLLKPPRPSCSPVGFPPSSPLASPSPRWLQREDKYGPGDAEGVWWGFYARMNTYLSRTLASAEYFFLFQHFSSSHWACIHTTYIYIHPSTASYLVRLPRLAQGASWNTPQRSRLCAALSYRLRPRMSMVAGHMRMLAEATVYPGWSIPYIYTMRR